MLRVMIANGHRPFPLHVQLVHSNARMPEYATIGSVGLDLYAAENFTIGAGRRKLVSVGIIVEIANGYEGQVRPAPRLATEYGVTMFNAPDTIDNDYRGEVKVMLMNHTASNFGFDTSVCIAQLIIAPCMRAVCIEVKNLAETARVSGVMGDDGALLGQVADLDDQVVDLDDKKAPDA